MKEILLKILIIAYTSQGIITLIAYWPTIKDLLSGKKSANTMSYMLWSIGAGIAFLYSLFILPDLIFIFVSALNFIACTTILVLALRYKKLP